MDFLKNFFKKDIVRRVMVLLGLGLVLYLLRGMANIFILTFIFTYVLYSAQAYIIRKLKKVIRIGQRVMIVTLFLTMIAFIAFVIYQYIPVLINECKSIFESAKDYINHPAGNPTAEYIASVVKDLNISDYVNSGIDIVINSISSVTKLTFDLIFALILSLFFLLEKNRIVTFTERFKNSRISFIYSELGYFGNKFLFTFGKVIQAQITIALINSLLSLAALWIMGFPHLLFLWAMIFALGLIPFLGVIISLIPLSIIAFSIGGLTKVIYILIMVALLHAMESYILNPKIMSIKTHLPVFYTFLILLISEHIMGVWGLIIGIPIFVFVMDLICSKDEPKVQAEITEPSEQLPDTGQQSDE